MEVARPRHILRTDQGKALQVQLDASTAFGMCLDVARFLLSSQACGQPHATPTLQDFTPDAWDELREAYRPAEPYGHPELIAARGMKEVSAQPLQGFGAHFLDLVYELIERRGTTLVGLVGHGGGHEFLWHRDDDQGVWLFFDPGTGLWKFDSTQGVAPSLAMDLVARYDAMAQFYRVATLELA